MRGLVGMVGVKVRGLKYSMPVNVLTKIEVRGFLRAHACVSVCVFWLQRKKLADSFLKTDPRGLENTVGDHRGWCCHSIQI